MKNNKKKSSAIILSIVLLSSLSITAINTHGVDYNENKVNNDNMISVARSVAPEIKDIEVNIKDDGITIEQEMKLQRDMAKEIEKEKSVELAKKDVERRNEKIITSRGGSIKRETPKEQKAEKMSNEQVAKLAINGKYGNGDARKLSIEQEGYNYGEIQKEVAKMLESTSSETVTSSNKKTTNVDTKQKVNKETVKPNQSSSSSRTMKATAYSTSEPGLSRYTADGTDLHTNPRVVAVDPSVIPLGTKVEIEGYGTYIAADTGGAIKGNRIDIHFKTVQECNNFGRRDVKVTIHR